MAPANATVGGPTTVTVKGTAQGQADKTATFQLNVRDLTGNKGKGKDDLSGFSTHAVVLQVPESKVTKNKRSVSGPDARNAVVGVWATTERKRVKVSRHKGRRHYKRTGCRSRGSATR